MSKTENLGREYYRKKNQDLKERANKYIVFLSHPFPNRQQRHNKTAPLNRTNLVLKRKTP